MTLKEKLLRAWRGDPEPELDPYNPGEDTNRPLSRHDLTKIADSYGEHETPEPPNIPSDIGSAPMP